MTAIAINHEGVDISSAEASIHLFFGLGGLAAGAHVVGKLERVFSILLKGARHG
jgi:hypothetical protein